MESLTWTVNCLSIPSLQSLQLSIYVCTLRFSPYQCAYIFETGHRIGAIALSDLRGSPEQLVCIRTSSCLSTHHPVLLPVRPLPG